MRTTHWLTITLIGMLAGAVIAQPPDAVGAIDRELGRQNDELQRLQGEEARARADLENHAALRAELAARDASLAALDERVRQAEGALPPIEQLMGWNDTDWWGLPAWVNKNLVPTLFGGDYGPHATEYRAALAALQAARKAREETAAAIDRELAARGGASPRTLAELRRAVDAGEFEEQSARARIARAAEQVAAVRQQIERLAERRRAAERRRRELEASEAPPAPSVAPPAEVPRLSGRVVDTTGLGRPENYAPIERCTWKFFVELTTEGSQTLNPFGGRILSVRREPEGIQKGTPATVGPGPNYMQDRILRAGPFYLTVQRQDGYRGSFRAEFAFAGPAGEDIRCEVAWNSPGRPPVGPPNEPPASAAPPAEGALVVSGNLDPAALDRKIHHVVKELGFVETSYTVGDVTLRILPPAVAGHPWQGLISPGQLSHQRHLKHQPTRHRKPDLEEWWTVSITLTNGEGRRDALSGAASVVHEYRSSWGAKARRVYPDERWHAVRQADGSYRMHVPGIEDGIPFRLEAAGGR